MKSSRHGHRQQLEDCGLTAIHDSTECVTCFMQCSKMQKGSEPTRVSVSSSQPSPRSEMSHVLQGKPTKLEEKSTFINYDGILSILKLYRYLP